MSLKESSDELNPTVRVPEVVEPASSRGAIDYLALAIATFGVGFIPLAPGTWGSLLGVGLYLLLSFLQLNKTSFLAVHVGLTFVITVCGIWAASQVERLSGRKDPGKVVVDEVAGQMVSLLPVTFVPNVSWRIWIIISFILFRLFDIVKPYPAKRMENLHGGLGIMCDDLVAGFYAAFFIIVGVSLIR